MLFASLAAAECLVWASCPYDEASGASRSRVLPINGLDLEDTVWYAIEVESDEDLGEATICFQTSSMDIRDLENAVGTVCTLLIRSQVIPTLEDPYEPFWDSGAGAIRLFDGQSGRDLVTTPLRIDTRIEDDLVEGRGGR